jgi:DNA-binding NtrC family response regulator
MVPIKKVCIVFLIQAETSIRDFVERILHEHGSLVFSASNAQSALHFLRGYQENIHLIIVDRSIPGMDGLELAERIATARPNARVVLMTETGAVNEVPKRWSDRLLCTPLQAEALRRQVEQALEQLPCETPAPAVRVTEAGQQG